MSGRQRKTSLNGGRPKRRRLNGQPGHFSIVKACRNGVEKQCLAVVKATAVQMQAFTDGVSVPKEEQSGMPIPFYQSAGSLAEAVENLQLMARTYLPDVDPDHVPQALLEEHRIWNNNNSLTAYNHLSPMLLGARLDDGGGTADEPTTALGLAKKLTRDARLRGTRLQARKRKASDTERKDDNVATPSPEGEEGGAEHGGDGDLRVADDFDGARPTGTQAPTPQRGGVSPGHSPMDPVYGDRKSGV